MQQVIIAALALGLFSITAGSPSAEANPRRTLRQWDRQHQQRMRQLDRQHQQNMRQWDRRWNRYGRPLPPRYYRGGPGVYVSPREFYIGF